MLMLAGLFLPLYLNGQMALLEKEAAPHTERQKADTAKEKQEEKDDIADVSPEEIISKLDSDAQKTRSWFSRERDNLLNFLIGSAVSILAGVFLTWLFRRLTQNRIDRQKNLWRWEILNVLTTPVILLAVLTSCFLFFFPVLKSLPRNLHDMDMRFFYAAVTLIIAWGVFGLVSVMDRKIRQFAERNDNTLDNLTVSMIGNTLKIAIAITTVLFIGQNIFHLDITALLAGAGVIGLAIALAAKDTVSNFFGTIVILFDRPFKLGDRIQVGEVEGVVTEVGMRSSKILADDESFYTLPNSLLTTQAVRNINLKNHLKFLFTVTMTYDTTEPQMRKAIQVLHEITDNFKGPDRPCFSPRIFFSGFASSSMNITVIMWLKTESYAQEEQWKSELNFAILKRFAEEKLTMAYPTTTTYLLTQKNAPLEIRMSETDPEE